MQPDAWRPDVAHPVAYPPPVVPYRGPAPQPRQHRLGLGGMIFGIVGMALAMPAAVVAVWADVYGFLNLGGGLAALGIVLSGIELNHRLSGSPNDRRMALVGMVCGAIGVVACGAVLALRMLEYLLRLV